MAIAALEDQTYYDDIRAKIIRSRNIFRDTLNRIDGITVFESSANFVYIRAVGYNVENIRRIADDHGYMIRIFNSNNEKHLRITIGTEEMMAELTQILLDAIPASKL